jgi:hypothetical protein
VDRRRPNARPEDLDAVRALRLAHQRAHDVDADGTLLHNGDLGEVLQTVRPAIRIVLIVGRLAVVPEVEPDVATDVDTE